MFRKCRFIAADHQPVDFGAEEKKKVPDIGWERGRITTICDSLRTEEEGGGGIRSQNILGQILTNGRRENSIFSASVGFCHCQQLINRPRSFVV